jgi:hypothetical protein
MSELKNIRLDGGPGDYTIEVKPEPVFKNNFEIDGATLGGMVNFVRSRSSVIIGRAHETSLLCDEDSGQLHLVIGENGRFTNSGNMEVSTHVSAVASLSRNFMRAKALFSTYTSPHDLFLKLREVPHLFADAGEHASVLNTLRNTTINLRKMLKDTSSDNAEREKTLKVAFEEHPPEVSWKFRVPIIEGADTSDITASVLWEANSEINGINLRVVNFSLDGLVERSIKQAMEQTVKDINDILGENTIPVVWTK